MSKKCEGNDAMLKISGKSPAHPVSTPDCGSWEALVPALQECSWSPSCCQGTAEVRICSILLRIPKHEWNLGSQPQKSRNNNLGQVIIITSWKPSKTATKHHICCSAVIFPLECPSTILHLRQKNIQDISFKGSTDVDVLLQICMRFRASFFKEHSNPSYVSLHIKDQNTAWGSTSVVLRLRHDMLCESICQGATVPLITRLQTPSSHLWVAQGTMLRLLSQGQEKLHRLCAYCSSLAQHWGSCYWLHRKCHCTSPVHHPANSLKPTTSYHSTL